MATQFQRHPVEPPITSDVQLLVEGNDQRNFFEALVEHLKLPDVQAFLKALCQPDRLDSEFTH